VAHAWAEEGLEANELIQAAAQAAAQVAAQGPREDRPAEPLGALAAAFVPAPPPAGPQPAPQPPAPCASRISGEAWRVASQPPPAEPLGACSAAVAPAPAAALSQGGGTQFTAATGLCEAEQTTELVHRQPRGRQCRRRLPQNRRGHRPAPTAQVSAISRAEAATTRHPREPSPSTSARPLPLAEMKSA
jgi:hypothetical protein